MNRHILFITLVAGLLSVMCQKAAVGGVSSDEQSSKVSLTITKFQVNDQNLELGWKITNGTDHDVWICDGLTTGYFECVLDKDNETLKIIKRSSLPQGPGWEHWPWVRFIRLRPGQEKEDSISLTVPVSPYTEFSHQRGNAEYARRVAIEIGFYDEDLRGLILNIVDLTEQLNCDISLLSSIVDPEAQIFHDESFRGFQNKVLSDGDEIPMPFMGQLFHGEQVLRIEIDGVSIPYKSNYPPLTDEPTPSETEPAGVTTVFTKFDVNDTNLELGFKIINNTDHDVWICDSMIAIDPNTYINYEVYLAEDAKTLVIRKRLDLPWPPAIVEIPIEDYLGRYLRLQPGQEKIDSISLTMPVLSHILNAIPRTFVEQAIASRLVLEIGYYNEDLPELIRSILEVAEKLDCTGFDIREGFSSDIFRRYFKGLLISHQFGPLSRFNEEHKDVSKEFLTFVTRGFLGEEVLQIAIEDMSIPYKGFIADPSWKSGTGHNQSQQNSSAEADKPGHEKG
jgi:hypothetical protein